MARSNTHQIHRFQKWQVWPGSFENPPVDGNFPAPEKGRFGISKSTPIASMGSCFAREIKRRLIQRDYNYITRRNLSPRVPACQRRLGARLQHPLHASDFRVHI